VNRRAQLICLSTGPVLTILFAIGAVWLGQFIPPAVHPSDSAQEVARHFADHADRIRLGAFLTIISMSLIAPFGVAIAVQFRRTEGRFPVWTCVQIASAAIATTIVVFMAMFWAVAAFRPGDYEPDTVRVLNDVAYFVFLFTWPPFSVWVLAVAMAIFQDETARPAYPRWAAYLNIWVAVLFVPAGLMAFFKHGAFSWAGLATLYIPVGIFFVWLAAMAVLTLRNINRGDVDLAPLDDPRLAGTPANARAFAGVN